MRVEEDPVLSKMRKKSKKSKKNENGDFEWACDTDIDGGVEKVVGMKGCVEADGGLQTENCQKLKKRKSKCKSRMNKNGDLQGAASGTELDVRRDEVVGMNGYVEENGDLQMGKGQKLKKRKSESKSKKNKNGDLQGDASDAVMTEVNVSANTTEEYKKRNNKKHDEADKKGSLEVDGDVEKEKEHRKKRKINFPSDEAASNEKSHIGEKILQIDGELDAGNDSELKPTKEKKKRNQEQRKKVKDMTESSSMGHGSEDPQPKRKSKKVSFSSDVEVFHSVVRGKRFSREEDEIVKEAVLNYIKVHCLGEDGLDMVMHCKAHPEIKNCWKEI